MAASTEPRPRGRGNTYGIAAITLFYELQRSRARAGAENRRADRRRRVGCLLQRSRARAGAERAGARYLDRRRGRFNGAAPARARKWRQESRSHRGELRFNGAAPARARK